MWAATLSIPSPVYAATRKTFRLNVRAQLSDYPLGSRIMLRNLPYSTEASTLKKEFSSFGQVAEVKVAKDAVTNKSKGFAFIQYTCQDDAMLALENMDQKVFDGRLIYVEIARPGKERFRGYPRTSGPPKNKQSEQEVDGMADCWY